MTGFLKLFRGVAAAAGYDPSTEILTGACLPGFYRRSKSWDLVVVKDEVLKAAIELKSLVGSVGNNFNNRIEEAVGNPVDLRSLIAVENRGWTPFIGYLLVFGADDPKCFRAVGKNNFAVPSGLGFDPAFHETSYIQRYEIALTRLTAGWTKEREESGGLYSAAAMVISPQPGISFPDHAHLLDESSNTRPFVDAGEPLLRLIPFMRRFHKALTEADTSRPL